MMRFFLALLGLIYITLLGVAVYVGSLTLSSILKSEDLTTSNLTPNMSGMTASGGTSVGTGHGCSQGQYCTSGTNEGGGTYTSNFDVPLTEAELNQGFTLNSGITINSHSSNSRLPTCANGLLQSGDCRDVFKLTIKLKDSGTVVETFVHQEELTWSGLKDFTYADAVGTNNYGLLTGVYELYGIDAGYPVGYYGPQFSNPGLTIDYQTALVTEDTTTLITDVIQTETETTIMDAATGGTGGTDITDITSSAVTVSIPAFQTYTNTASTTTINAPVDNSSSSGSVFTPPVDTASASTETTMTSAPVIETAAAAPTIAPVASQTETQQAEETQAETQIETAMVSQPVAAETASSETTEPAPTTKTVAKAKPQKAKTQKKTASSSTTVVVPVAVPVTAAVAAQAVVDNIAPSQKYGNTAQTVTLVAMGMIANNKGLFKTSALPDTPKFFSNSSVPDGPSMVDRMTNYQVFGQSNGLHNELVESQWRN